MGTKHLGIVLVLLALALPATPARAGGMVSVCDETHLRAALSGGGTVTFSCSGTITLTAEIVIAADTTIDGSGQTITISGNHAVRVFIVNSGATLDLNELTVSNGNAYDEGGAVYSYHGTLTVHNSTFFSNYTNCDYQCEGGGAIYSKGGTLTVSDSTFSDNGASGGGILNNNYNGTVMIKNTIVANSPTGSNCSGAIITDGGGNLSYPDTNCPGINADPMLGPLQDNGGPTWTLALLPGSAAIGVGDDAICAENPVNGLDQRGITRPQGPHCDIGAVEQVPITNVWLPAARAR